MVAWKHLFSCWERKVLFSTIAKPGMFGLAMMLKDNFFDDSAQFIFLIKRFVPGNAAMVPLDMDGTSPITEKWINVKTCIPFYVFVYLLICLMSV